jgi:hypothetical protein
VISASSGAWNQVRRGLYAGGRWIRTSGSWSRDRQTVMGEVTAFSKPGADLLGNRRSDDRGVRQQSFTAVPRKQRQRAGLRPIWPHSLKLPGTASRARIIKPWRSILSRPPETRPHVIHRAVIGRGPVKAAPPWDDARGSRRPREALCLISRARLRPRWELWTLGRTSMARGSQGSLTAPGCRGF